MDILFHRLLLIAVSTVIALHFPELIAWHRLRGAGGGAGDARLPGVLSFLKILLRIVFFFYIVLLAYTLYHDIPSRFLVYPLPLVHLVALIVGERDLIAELPRRGAIDTLVRFLMAANLLEIGLLTAIALQVHGVIPA